MIYNYINENNLHKMRSGLENIYKQMKGNNKDLNVGGVLYVRRIGSAAIVSPRAMYLTREILVLRVSENNKYGLTHHYLLYCYRIGLFQAFNKVLIETTLPNIADR